MSLIYFERRLHAALHFHLLAHLDLGRDAASLHDPALSARRPPWLPELKASYLESPRRLQAQVLPLRAPDLPCMLNDLKEDRAGLGRLSGALLDALRAEMPEAVQRWRAAAPVDEARIAEVEAEISAPLRLLRGALWALKDREPPSLQILDAPALSWAGRGASHAAQRRAAVSLAMPSAHALCQIFHEEVHAVSDGWLPEGDAPRSTREGQRGFSQHQALEVQAIDLGRELIDLVTPEWSAAYEAWAGRFSKHP